MKIAIIAVAGPVVSDRFDLVNLKRTRVITVWKKYKNYGAKRCNTNKETS